METEVRNNFRLNFVSDLGVMMTLDIPNANTNADGDQVTEAMQAIINSNAVESVRGRPQESYAAQLVTVERRGINVRTP